MRWISDRTRKRTYGYTTRSLGLAEVGNDAGLGTRLCDWNALSAIVLDDVQTGCVEQGIGRKNGGVMVSDVPLSA